VSVVAVRFDRQWMTRMTGFRLKLFGAAARAAGQRRFILLGAFLIAAIAGADWLVINAEHAASIEDFRTATSNLANGMAAQTTRPLVAADGALRGVQGALAGGANDEIGATMRGAAVSSMLAARQARLAGADLLALVDAHGKLANASPAWLAPGTDVSGADYFRHLAANAPATAAGAGDAGLYAGPPTRDPATGEWHSILARRIDDSHGAFAGIALARISLTGMEDFFRTAMPPHRTVTVALRDGTVLVRFPHRDDAVGWRIPQSSPWHAAAANGGGSYVATEHFDHVRVVSVVRKLRGLPFVLEASVTEANALAGWRIQRVWLIGGGVASCAVVIALLWLFAVQLRRLALKNAQLDEARNQLDVAMTNMSQGLCLYDGEQRLIVCNRRYGEIYHLPPAAMQRGVTLAEVVDHSFAAFGNVGFSRADYLMSRQAIIRTGERNQSVIETADGTTIAIHQQPMPDGGWLATHEDITERRRAEHRIAFLAQHDVLTGLPNRSLLHARIEEARGRAARGTNFAILFLDLDRFKAVNDTLGHGAGDELLRAVAARLLATVRDGDTVARLGGDEFVVLQGSMKVAEDSAVLAQRIITSVGAPYTILENEVVIGVSVGIDTACGAQVTADDLLKNADMALYISKSEGRGTFRFFQPAMDAKVQNRHSLERDMRCALSRGQFELYYQPIVHAKSGRVCGFEALLRWNHPERGVVGPDDFIVVAEECGVIIPLGEWVIAQACREAAQWPDHFTVSVNLSVVQFRAANLAEVVRDQLAASGLAAGRLRLEITETVLLHSNERNMALLHELRACGVGIVMDDFGVGYSSLSYLRQFPFDGIKIDRSFISDLATRADAVYLVRAIVGLCRDLGIRSTAEGVETAAQMEILLAEGCVDLQGYLFSRPKPTSRLGAMMSGGSMIREGKEAVLF
jgi:diguanylate cyclase (GGDEF)-like protein